MTSRRIAIGLTGGVACYKTAALVSHLVQSGCDVEVVMTDAAVHFVGPATFQALTGRPVRRGVFDEPGHPLGSHIHLARDCELLCVAPATANFLAKAAHGLADDLISTLYLAFAGPVVVAPAMNSEMWASAAVERNVEQLRRDGVEFVGPESGWLSCRTSGAGRMAEPAAIAEVIRSNLPLQDDT
ncbi:MAG: flavoprotein [Pirellulales bacterium]|nr:phosphopantothenoylcysteine decarboxylase [Planctomycetales bacterium]